MWIIYPKVSTAFVTQSFDLAEVCLRQISKILLVAVVARILFIRLAGFEMNVPVVERRHCNLGFVLLVARERGSKHLTLVHVGALSPSHGSSAYDSRENLRSHFGDFCRCWGIRPELFFNGQVRRWCHAVEPSERSAIEDVAIVFTRTNGTNGELYLPLNSVVDSFLLGLLDIVVQCNYRTSDLDDRLALARMSSESLASEPI